MRALNNRFYTYANLFSTLFVWYWDSISYPWIPKVVPRVVGDGILLAERSNLMYVLL